jgi:hypothetical protein
MQAKFTLPAPALFTGAAEAIPPAAQYPIAARPVSFKKSRLLVRFFKAVLLRDRYAIDPICVT